MWILGQSVEKLKSVSWKIPQNWNFYFRNSEKHFFITSESFASSVSVWHNSTYMEFTNVKRVFGSIGSINGMGLLHIPVNFVDKLAIQEFN